MRKLRPEDLLWLPVALSMFVGLLVIYTWLVRLSYPYDLEWMEGGVLAHAWRLQHLKPVYVHPSTEFIPMIYPPGYPALVALIGLVTGISHPLGRLISILGILASAGGLIWGARRHLDNANVGIIAAGCFLGMYAKSGGFYDLVRPDSLHLGLLTWSMLMALEKDDRSIRRAGVLLALSFMVKHNAAIYGFPLAFGVLVRNGWRQAAVFAAWAAVPGLVFTLFMQVVSGGLFTTWLLDVPRSHPMVEPRMMPGTFRETAHAMPIIIAFLGPWLLSLGPRLAPRVPTPVLTIVPTLAAGIAFFYLGGLPPVEGIERPAPYEAFAMYTFLGIGVAIVPLALLGMVLRQRLNGDFLFAAGVVYTAWITSCLMRGHHGGFINVFMFMHWASCGMFAMGLADLIKRIPTMQGAAVAALVASLASGQLGWRYYANDFHRLQPDAADRAAGDAVVAWLKENAEPPILSPFNPWLAAQAGFEPGWALIAMWDIRHPEGPFREDAIKVLEEIRKGAYGTVIDSDEGADLGYPKAYEKTHTFQSDRSTMMPKTGWRARPNVIWTRKEP